MKYSINHFKNTTIIILSIISLHGCSRSNSETYKLKNEVYIVYDIDIVGCPEIFFEGSVIDRAIINPDYLERNRMHLEEISKAVQENKSIKVRLEFSDSEDDKNVTNNLGKYRASNQVIKVELVK